MASLTTASGALAFAPARCALTRDGNYPHWEDMAMQPGARQGRRRPGFVGCTQDGQVGPVVTHDVCCSSWYQRGEAGCSRHSCHFYHADLGSIVDPGSEGPNTEVLGHANPTVVRECKSDRRLGILKEHVRKRFSARACYT